MAKKEALDAVKDERPFAAVHILATALLCAAGSSPQELELARRLLERDPKKDAPREAESVAGAFNRHMDAAIDSVNDSIGEPTRAGRRARLAIDLSRADLVLMDRAMVAALIQKIHELEAAPPRVHVPASAAPSFILRRAGDDWLIAEMHGGREIAAFTPKQARRQANRLIEMAWLATHPGECPKGAFE